MRTYHPDNDDYMTNGGSDCGCEQCLAEESLPDDEGVFYDDPYVEDDDVYDDPYDVVMYDIDEEQAEDLHALLYMLNDMAKVWFAKRRLNVLASAGPLHALVGNVIIDSRGRKWNPLLHPRDRFGRFIETGGFFRWFLKGVWNKGQVVRIDSDGTIYARSKGNDRIPDGTLLKFNHKDAAKFISTASDKASLSGGDLIDLDVDIPDFPEASPTQKRVYNALQFGDMPGVDVDMYLPSDATDGTEIGNEIADLRRKGLIDIFEGPDGPRIRRTDDQVATLDAVEIDDVPDDETPDIDDGPTLTRAQRDLVDRMVDLDRGEGDGVLRDEIADASDEDLQALVEAGVLDHDGDLVDSPYHLNNPEGVDATPGDDSDSFDESGPDIVDEIDNAAQERFGNDVDQQDLFIARANELAGLEEPDESREYDRKEKRARDAADKWWSERNSGDAAVDSPEDDSESPAPAEKKRAEYREEAKELLDLSAFPEDYFDTPEGEKYLQGVTDLLYAADLEEQGQTQRADLNRRGGLNKIRDAGVAEEDVNAWPDAVEAWRADQRNIDTPDPNVPEDVPESDIPESDDDESNIDLMQRLRDMVHAGDSGGDGGDGTPEVDVAPEPEERSDRDNVIEALDLNYPDENAEYESYLNESVDRIVEDYNGPFRDDVNNGRTDDMTLEEFAREFDVQDEADFNSGAPDRFIGYNENDRLPEGLPRNADAPESDVDVDIPDTDAPESDAGPIDPVQRQWLDWEERVIARRDDDDTLADAINDEKMLADEMGLDLDQARGVLTWTALEGGAGPDVAGELYEKHNGDVDVAMRDLLQNPAEYLDRVQAHRDGGNVPDAPDATDAPDLDAPEGDRPWDDFARRLNAEGPESDFGARLAQEQRIAREMGLDLFDEDAPWNWNNVGDTQDYNVVKRAFDENDGEIGRAAANDAFDNKGRDVSNVNAPDAGASDVPPAPDATPASGNTAHQRIVNQEPFNIDDFDYITLDGKGVKDRNGEPVEIGGWYKANRGGGGDLPQVVGFYDQDEFPGWLLGRNPDGKYKAVHVHGEGGEGGLGGMNRIPNGDIRAEQGNWAAQRRIKGGEDIEELDQFKAANRMHADGGAQPAAVGMMVERARERKGVKWQAGEPAIIHRFGMNAKDEVIAYVARGGEEHQGQLVEIPVKLLKQYERPDTPTPPTAIPDAPNAPDVPNLELPVGAWQRQSDDELLDRLRGQDWVPMVELVNAHVDGNRAWEQINQLRDEGRLEFHPEGIDGKPQVRVVDADVPGDVNAPNLPDGAEDEFEAVVLRAIDGADGAGLRRSEMVDLDSPEAIEQLDAINVLVSRGVLEEVRDGNGGPAVYRRFQAPDQAAPEAENEVQASILEAVDGLDRPALRSDLLDPDAPDFEDRMEAIRALVDRGILRQATNRETGKLEFRRPSGSSSAPTPMTDDEAVNALRNGADPMLIANNSLDRALNAAGLKRVRNGQAGISPNDWVMSSEDGPFPVKLKGYGPQDKKVYMVKRSGRLENDMLNEVMAGAISNDLLDRLGRDDENGPLFHPRVGIAEAPDGLGYRAGGAIIMDHAAYGYPEGHEFYAGVDFEDDELRRGGASKDIIQLALYDFIINNSEDRHKNNQMFVKDPATGQIRVVIIDNGFGFSGGMPQDASFDDYVNRFNPGRVVRRADRDRTLVTDAVQNFIDNYQQMDVESTMERIRAAYPTITPEQEGYAREWLETAKSRVDGMAENVDGIVNAIMNA